MAVNDGMGGMIRFTAAFTMAKTTYAASLAYAMKLAIDRRGAVYVIYSFVVLMRRVHSSPCSLRPAQVALARHLALGRVDRRRRRRRGRSG